MVYFHVYWTRGFLRSRRPLILPTVLCPPGGSRESHQMRAPHSGEPLSRPPTNCQKTPTNLMVAFSGVNSYSGSPNGEWFRLAVLLLLLSILLEVGGVRNWMSPGARYTNFKCDPRHNCHFWLVVTLWVRAQTVHKLEACFHSLHLF